MVIVATGLRKGIDQRRKPSRVPLNVDWYRRKIRVAENYDGMVADGGMGVVEGVLHLLVM